MRQPGGSLKLSATCWILAVVFAPALFGQTEPPALKQRSAFYTAETLARVQQNLREHPEGARFKKQAADQAAFWKHLSDDELWGLMFGPRIKRSWMVWSDGHCPACRKPVEMYKWIIEPQRHRWKVRCPHCAEFFPKNDFEAFHRSGLDDHGVFDPQRADRKLLFNTAHPDPHDPLHRFGVDDGDGYVEDGKRWRFIGAYLIYGQFKELVLGGARALATAYVFTGDPVYARKAGILLDRVADLYPGFDFASQGLVYERSPHHGYVSVWHDACEETRELALAYDQVFAAMRDDKELVAFLSRKAAAHKLSNTKSTFADIQRNIENGILRDALRNKHKIHSNFPRAECTVATLLTTLAWPDNRAEVEAFIDAFVRRATAVDGVTGEKGLSGYTAYTISGMAAFLAGYARNEPDFLRNLLARQPSLRQTYRFHIDTLCLDRYYPDSGDCGNLGAPRDKYVGAHFQKLTGTSLAPSMFSFFWQLYEATEDVDYARILYRENGRTLEGLPHDLFAENPEALRAGVAEVIRREGADLDPGSINKQAWRIAILRSGQQENARAVWLDYDAGGAHGHRDGMTLGLFAHGLDLLPDFGYPPVQFGGWTTPRAQWYLKSAAHNTVVVDAADHHVAHGQTTLWADGEQFRAIRASCPQLIGGSRFERTIASVDSSEREFYVVDVFRVAGGADHAKFIHGAPGTLSTDGLALESAPDFGAGTQMRHFRRDAQPKDAWSADWKLAERAGRVPGGGNIRIRYSDLTEGAAAYTAETWIAPPFNADGEEFWNPSVMVRRQGPAPLASTFVGVFEAFDGASSIARIRRLPLRDSSGNVLSGSDVAVQIEFRDGRHDLIIAADAGRLKELGALVQADWKVSATGELACIRRAKDGRWQRAALCLGTELQLGGTTIESAKKEDFIEVEFTASGPRILAGDVRIR